MSEILKANLRKRTETFNDSSTILSHGFVPFEFDKKKRHRHDGSFSLLRSKCMQSDYRVHSRPLHSFRTKPLPVMLFAVWSVILSQSAAVSSIEERWYTLLPVCNMGCGRAIRFVDRRWEKKIHRMSTLLLLLSFQLQDLLVGRTSGLLIVNIGTSG